MDSNSITVDSIGVLMWIWIYTKSTAVIQCKHVTQMAIPATNMRGV